MVSKCKKQKHADLQDWKNHQTVTYSALEYSFGDNQFGFKILEDSITTLMDSWCYVSNRLRRTNMNLWQNVWWCWYQSLMIGHQLAQSEWGLHHIHFYQERNSAEPDETQRLIWVHAVCIWSLFSCNQPVPQVRTLNFRLATPCLFVWVLTACTCRGLSNLLPASIIPFTPFPQYYSQHKK